MATRELVFGDNVCYQSLLILSTRSLCETNPFIPLFLLYYIPHIFIEHMLRAWLSVKYRGYYGEQNTQNFIIIEPRL